MASPSGTRHDPISVSSDDEEMQLALLPQRRRRSIPIRAISSNAQLHPGPRTPPSFQPPSISASAAHPPLNPHILPLSSLATLLRGLPQGDPLPATRFIASTPLYIDDPELPSSVSTPHHQSDDDELLTP